MRTFSTIILCVIIGLSFFNTPCDAGPFSKIISTFQRDLVINVLYKNHKNLIPGSKVYLEEDPEKQKVLIGKVNAVSLTESRMSKVEIIIDKKYKEQIYETTRFVLMSNIFSENPDVSIVAVSPLETSDKTHLKSGSSVNGVTFLEYKIANAGEDLKKMKDSIKKQNDAILDQLEQYTETFNTEAFRKKMEDLINQISEFSAAQKETFKNEVLPSLKKTFDLMMEKLQEQNNSEKAKDLEKQYEKIEDLISV